MSVTDGVVGRIRKKMYESDSRRIKGQTQPAGVDVAEYAYVNDGEPMHTLNVYRPAGNREKLPLVVDVHGGAWIYGDKELNRYYCMYLASKGYCVVGMSYRLVPETDLGGQIADVFAAMNFVAEHADEFGCDTDGFMMTGDSAGGHLSSLALCAMLDKELALRCGVPVPENMRASCLVMSHPVCEIHSVLLRKNLRPARFGRTFQRMFEKVMFGKKAKKHRLYAYSSFAEYAKNVTLPPLMVIGCERDIYARHTLYLAGELSRMVDAGRCGKFELDFVKEEEETRRLGHVYNIVRSEWKESERVNDLSLAFFDECRAEYAKKSDCNEGE